MGTNRIISEKGDILVGGAEIKSLAFYDFTKMKCEIEIEGLSASSFIALQVCVRDLVKNERRQNELSLALTRVQLTPSTLLTIVLLLLLQQAF